MNVYSMNWVVTRAVWTLLPDLLTTPINRPPWGFLKGEESSVFITVHRVFHTFAPHHLLVHLRIFSSCSGSGSLQLFDPNIWRPPCSKPENNPNNATEKSQPTSTSRQRLIPNHRPKPTPIPTIIQSNPPHHHQSYRASDI
jgi:hypothetical protein